MGKFIMSVAFLFTVSAQAEEVASVKADYPIARVVHTQHLEKKGDQTQVIVSTVDLGGSTDMSPTQRIYFSLYRKGEMFSTDAAFPIDQVFSFESAKRITDGLYIIRVMGDVDDSGNIGKVEYRIDARKALTEIEKVECGTDFDCEASTNFASTITVERKH